jgi:tRNA (guanine-N7-)-methyltransferase
MLRPYTFTHLHAQASHNDMTDSSNDPSDASHRRSIRSFVLRTGRATAGQLRALEELWPKYGITEEGVLDLDRLFGRRAQRMLEIGFGAGEALLAFAQAHRELDCLGIEVHRPGVGHLMLGAEDAALTNLRIMDRDAVEVLRNQLPPASLSAAHIFFPDPWHKKRHHKRRLIQPPFIELLSRVIEPQGVLRLATDWEHYAMQMREVLDASSEFENVAGTEGYMPRNELRPLTRFERRGHRLGHGVWDLEYRRKS